MAREKWEIRTKYTETKRANLKVPVADGGVSHTAEYDSGIDYFMEFLKFMKHRAKNKKKKRYIVFENFESIINNDDLVRELTNFIIMVDDDEVLKYNTKLIIVAATSDVQKYFKKVSNINTIDNRIMELPEIKTLTTQQSFDLFRRGFNKLDIKFEPEELVTKFEREIAWLTGGIPQRLHEFCLELSLMCMENGWVAEEKFLKEATTTWLSTSLNKNYAAITKIFDYNNKRISRKNR